MWFGPCVVFEHDRARSFVRFRLGNQIVIHKKQGTSAVIKGTATGTPTRNTKGRRTIKII